MDQWTSSLQLNYPGNSKNIENTIMAETVVLINNSIEFFLSVNLKIFIEIKCLSQATTLCLSFNCDAFRQDVLQLQLHYDVYLCQVLRLDAVVFFSCSNNSVAYLFNRLFLLCYSLRIESLLEQSVIVLLHYISDVKRNGS